MSRIISEHWFTEGKSPFFFGLVVCEDEATKERKAYIGTCVAGNAENQDAQVIKDYGCKVYPNQLREILELLEKKNA